MSTITASVITIGPSCGSSKASDETGASKSITPKEAKPRSPDIQKHVDHTSRSLVGVRTKDTAIPESAKIMANRIKGIAIATTPKSDGDKIRERIGTARNWAIILKTFTDEIAAVSSTVFRTDTKNPTLNNFSLGYQFVSYGKAMRIT